MKANKLRQGQCQKSKKKKGFTCRVKGKPPKLVHKNKKPKGYKLVK